MRKFGPMVLLTALVLSSSARAASVADFANFSLMNDSGSTLLPGRLYVPPEATSDPESSRPLILFLHGGGEAGTNNVAQVNGNIDNLLAEAKRRGAFLYAPQSPGNWSGLTTTDRVMSMIDRALEDYNVDVDRLYITGLSNGGGGTWNMLSRYDGRFAAGVPICPVSPAADFVPANLLDDPIWAFHARNDGVVSVNASRNVINRILAAANEAPPTYPTSAATPQLFTFSSSGRDLTYFEPALGGHGIWPAVYNLPELYDWLFAHTLAIPEPSTMLLVAIAALATLASARGRFHRACV